ncbi:hypothetical protein [Variovorax boronicumulans]|uniref:hypothetical protein n=1 Tax=Variovorax boronicumulans TaxID=436515 RepID=UPI003393BCDF
MKKNHAVSVTALHQNPPPAFMPVEGQAMACLIGGSVDRIADVYLVEPSARHPRFFFVSHLSDCHMRVDYSTKPMRADFVEVWLKAEGLSDPASASWKAQACEGVYKAGQSLHAVLGAA